LFLKQASKDMEMTMEHTNLFALTQSWLAKNTDFAGLLGKFAHGNISTLEEDVLKCSNVVGDIIKFYYHK
jgi:hypothetical protein